MRYLGMVASVAVATAFVACGGDDNNNGNPGGGAMDAGGEPGSEAGAPTTGGKNGSGGSAGTSPGTAGVPASENGGAGGEQPLGPASMGLPRNGNGAVVDGIVAHSKNFTMVLAVGEEPGGSTSMFSKKYRINLGVVGSTQK